MQPGLFRYILTHSLRQQILLALMVVASYGFVFANLQLPKMIVDDAIQGDPAGFPVELYGYELDQLSYLWALSALFLLIVVINQGFKYAINVYRGVLAERMLRRLRYMLYGQVLRFPPPAFRHMSQGEIIPMITAEVEPVGGFIGDSISLPLFQGGTLVVILVFLFLQNPIIALAATALYPMQIYLIPRLQARVNRLAKARVRLVRRLSDRIGESVSTIEETHVHGTGRRELSRFAGQLHDIFDVRFQIYLWKFVIKFINNFINQLGPFFFYSLGGYLVLTDQMSMGALIAGLAAHKDLAAPWKELLTYYQRQADARIKFDQVISQFHPEGTMSAAQQLARDAVVPPLDGTLSIKTLSVTDEDDTRLLENVTLDLPLNRSVAVIGTADSGRDHLLRVLARLQPPTRGQIEAQGVDLLSLPEPVLGQRLGFVSNATPLFNATLGEVLTYPLAQVPVQGAPNTANAERKRYVFEAAASGNLTDDPAGTWVDPTLAKAPTLKALNRRIEDILRRVDLAEDVFDLGLRGTVTVEEHPGVVGAVMIAREAFQHALVAGGRQNLIEPFDPTRYNSNASVAENVLFGHYLGHGLEELTEHPYMTWVLDRIGLETRMLDIGYQVAETMVELFSDATFIGTDLFEQFSFINADELPDFQEMIGQVERGRAEELPEAERRRLRSLPFKLVPARHRLGLVDAFMQKRLLEARKVFASHLPLELADRVAFFRRDEFTRGAPVLDNILFGKIAHGVAGADAAVITLLREVVEEAELFDELIGAGLTFQIGLGGGRLSQIQRQKLAIARVLLKDPDILLLSDPTSGMDRQTADKMVEAVFESRQGRGMIWSLSRPSLADRFDRVVVLRQGRVVEQGAPGELATPGTYYSELLTME